MSQFVKYIQFYLNKIFLLYLFYVDTPLERIISIGPVGVRPSERFHCTIWKVVHVKLYSTHERIFGIFRVGIVVTSCPQRSVPTPKNRHHNHCSKVKLFVENAILPY